MEDVIIEVMKGEHIAKVAEKLVAAARESGSVTEATFNDVRLVATPDSSADDVYRYYADECRRGAATDSRDFDAARIRRLEYTNERLRIELAELRESARAEAADLRIKLQAAVSVLLEFAGRLGVGDDELADRLADAQMRAEARP
jgi:O-acetyl-ADP-ribose deacetylase (regulator of RNase III)